jgi:uridine kinase
MQKGEFMSDIDKKPLTIGVAGGTGSGKSTVSAALLERVGETHIAYIPHDTYYRSLEDMPRTTQGHANFDHPDSLDTTLMIKNIRDLQAGQPTDLPIYDFRNHTRLDETRRIDPQPIILVEGILIFVEPEVRQLLDIRIFVDTDADIRLIRRLRRDIVERGRTVDSVIDQYLESVRPMHLEFVEPTRRYADVIIPEGGHNNVAIDMIADRIRHLI